MTGERFKRDQVVVETGGGVLDIGMILAAGPVTYDIIWECGGTSRYRYRDGRNVRLATLSDFNNDEAYRERTRVALAREAAEARKERREGAGVRRGHVTPSR